MSHSMKQILALLAALATGPVIAAPGGPIATLQLGSYVCELPGDATGPAGLRVPDQDFAIINASSYAAAGGRGSYLLTGDTVAVTSGPKKGQRFTRVSNSFLRLIDANGTDSPLRCIRQVTNNR
jgi:hypothetical protein